MDDTSIPIGNFGDPRLAAHAIGAAPAWLWSLDGDRVIWANPAGCAALGALTLKVLAKRVFAPDASVRIQIARLAATLPQNGAPRLQRLRGFANQGPHLWRPLVCSCSLHRLGNVAGVWVEAAEAIGAALSLAEQVRRLGLDADTAFAAFAPEGSLLFATVEGYRRLGDDATINAIGAKALTAAAMATGDAAGDCAIGPVTLRRIGNGAATVLLARFGPPPAVPDMAAPAPALPTPAENPERRDHAAAVDEPLPSSPSREAALERDGDDDAHRVAANVVPFPSPISFGEARSNADHRMPALSPGEHVTFRELARTLAERLQEVQPSPAPPLVREHASATQPATAATVGYAATTGVAGRPAAWIFHDPPPAFDDYALLNQLPIGILIYRVDELLLANRAFLAMTGYADLGAVSGAGGVDALLMETDIDALADNGETGKRIAIAARGGNQLPVEARLLAVRWNNQPAVALLLSKNEAGGHVQLAETTLRHAEAQPSALRNVPTLLPSRNGADRPSADTALPPGPELPPTVSHDAGTSLSSILGCCDIILDERHGPIGNDRYRECIAEIRRDGLRLMALLADIFEPASRGAGTVPAALGAIDLNTTVRECVAQMQLDAREGHVIVRTSLSPATTKIMADADAVRRIVSSLLGHAIAGSRPGGQVIVSTGISPDGDVMLRLRDNGFGLSDQAVAAAMRSGSVQATSGPMSSESGSLARTKALAEANHARFKITSRPHDGSLFELTFPETPGIQD
jgi:signal transduction histidine kinase